MDNMIVPLDGMQSTVDVIPQARGIPAECCTVVCIQQYTQPMLSVPQPTE